MSDKKEVLSGGRADNKPDSSFSSKALSKGVKVESEHTTNKAVRKEIAKDHLTEDSRYYDKLQKMEESKPRPRDTMEKDPFPGLEQAFKNFIFDNESPPFFNSAFGKGRGSNFFQSPGIVSVSADIRMVRKPKGEAVKKSSSFSILSGAFLKSADKGKQEEKKQEKPKLGPLEHAYVADAVGATPHQRLADLLPTKRRPDSSWYDRMLMATAPLDRVYGKRVQIGASRLANNPKLRLLSLIDPTAAEQSEGLVGLAASQTYGNEADLLAKTREKYKQLIKPHQDKLIDPDGPVTSRETPWHLGAQAILADKDSDVAGHTYFRRNRPLHYWLNPFSKSGPSAEIHDRLLRRSMAGIASHESTGGRFAAGAIPFYAPIVGGQEAQNKLRRSAVRNNLYDPVAEPEVVQKSGSMTTEAWIEAEMAQFYKSADDDNPTMWDKMKNQALITAGNVANQFNPDQFGRAYTTFHTRKDSDGIFPALAAGHGQLSDTVRGLSGGGAGMLAGAMLPANMRSIGMPLATGLGAAFAMANGPNGFEWKNMLSPQALTAGGIGALAGYLGSQAMGGDEGDEEETDLLGRPVRRRRSSGGGLLMPALGLGAAGLGGYALYNYLNKNKTPPPPTNPSVLGNAPQAVARGVAGLGNAAGRAAGAIGSLLPSANSVAAAPPAPPVPPPAPVTAPQEVARGIAGAGNAVGRAVGSIPSIPVNSAFPRIPNAASAIAGGIKGIGNAMGRAATGLTIPSPGRTTSSPSSLLTPNQQGMVNRAMPAVQYGPASTTFTPPQPSRGPGSTPVSPLVNKVPMPKQGNYADAHDHTRGNLRRATLTNLRRGLLLGTFGVGYMGPRAYDFYKDQAKARSQQKELESVKHNNPDDELLRNSPVEF